MKKLFFPEPRKTTSRPWRAAWDNNKTGVIICRTNELCGEYNYFKTYNVRDHKCDRLMSNVLEMSRRPVDPFERGEKPTSDETADLLSVMSVCYRRECLARDHRTR